MTSDRSFSRRDLARMCGGTLKSEADADLPIIRGVAALHEAGSDQLTWIAHPRFAPMLTLTKAAAIIGPANLLGIDPRAVIVDDTESALADLLTQMQEPRDAPALGIHPSAVIDPSARLGEAVAIGALAVIRADAQIADRSVVHEGAIVGRGVRIGRDSILHDRVVIYDDCTIGDRVILHAGVVIGADGFGYIFRQGNHRRIPHVGSVVIEDDVEIGANSCIDRAKVGATRIGRGSKIDNLVQIAHNVQLGPLCIIAAQCGFAGSAVLGAGVVAAGHVGIVDGARVGDQARLGAQCVVTCDLPGGRTYLGFPAQERTAELRDHARVRKLPELFDQVHQLEERIKLLESSAHHPKAG